MKVDTKAILKDALCVGLAIAKRGGDDRAKAIVKVNAAAFEWIAMGVASGY